MASADCAAAMSERPGSISLVGLSLVIASRARAASDEEPLRLSSWAFQNCTSLLFGSFFKAASKWVTAAEMSPWSSATWASSRSPAAASLHRLRILATVAATAS